jgi:acetyl esterase/lipase
MSCDSWDSNAPFDVVPRPNPNDHLNPVACYLGASMEKYLTHPYASPLFGNFKGLPPMLVQSGDAEVLRDEITLLAHKATLAGVEVRHELFEDAVRIHLSTFNPSHCLCVAA